MTTCRRCDCPVPDLPGLNPDRRYCSRGCNPHPDEEETSRDR